MVWLPRGRTEGGVVSYTCFFIGKAIEGDVCNVSTPCRSDNGCVRRNKKPSEKCRTSPKHGIVSPHSAPDYVPTPHGAPVATHVAPIVEKDANRETWSGAALRLARPRLPHPQAHRTGSCPGSPKNTGFVEREWRHPLPRGPRRELLIRRASSKDSGK